VTRRNASAGSAGARVLIGLLIAAVNMRLAIASVGPLTEEIRADTGMSSPLAGALTTIPYACMGAFSFAGPGLVVRLGAKHALTLGLALIAGGALVRAAMPTPALLLAATLPIGAGIALAGVVIPVVIKHHFPSRAATVTGAYSTGIAVGIAVAGFAAVPLAAALGGWRGAFAAFAVPTLLALPAWAATRVSDHRVEDAPVADAPAAGLAPDVPPAGLFSLAPSRTALVIGAFFALDTFCITGMVSWGAAAYEAAGWEASDASAAVWSMGLLAIAASLTIPALSDRGDRRVWLAGMSAVMALGLAGIALVPTSAAPVWLVAFGFGSGATLALALTLPLDLASAPARVAELSAWMLGLGLSAGALGPIAVGALRDAGGFDVAIGMLAAVSLAHAFVALAIPRRRH
jgi:MFS transporter, CP family, cyanate transporter